MMARPMVAQSNAPASHSCCVDCDVTAVLFSFAAMYAACSMGFTATRLSYASDKNSFWQSDRSEYAKREIQ